MKVIVNLTQNDCWNFNKHSLRHNKRIRSNFLKNVMAVPFLVAFMSFSRNHSIGSIIVDIILSIPFAYFVMLYLVKRRAIRHIQSGEGVTGEHTIEINEEGLTEITNVNNSLHLWKGITEIEQNADYIYIHIDKYRAYIIPKKSFKSEEELSEFYNSAIKFWKSES